MWHMDKREVIHMSQLCGKERRLSIHNQLMWECNNTNNTFANYVTHCIWQADGKKARCEVGHLITTWARQATTFNYKWDTNTNSPEQMKPNILGAQTAPVQSLWPWAGWDICMSPTCWPRTPRHVSWHTPASRAGSPWLRCAHLVTDVRGITSVLCSTAYVLNLPTAINIKASVSNEMHWLPWPRKLKCANH